MSDEDKLLKDLRGQDRGPTAEEIDLPPDQRLWTEYDKDGNKQPKVPFKACPFKMGLLCGPACCVFELQWCTWLCGPDADRTCDVICRCQTNRMKMCLCCGPQCDEQVLPDCCRCCFCKRDAAISVHEACECDCLSNTCGPRYAGFQVCCCHWTCVQCPPCCTGCLCCKEEVLYMDGDLKPMPKAPDGVTMNRA